MQITVTKRLILMLLCGMVATILIGAVGVIQMGRIKEQLDIVQSRYSPAIETGSSFALAFADMRRASALYTNTSSDKVREIAKKQLSDAMALMRQRFSELKAHALGTEEEKRLIDQEGELVEKYLAANDKLVTDLSAPGADIQALTESAPKTLTPIAAELFETLVKHRQLHYGLMQQSEEASAGIYSSAWLTMLIAGLIGLAALAVIGARVIRDVRSRLNKLCAHIDSVNHSLDFTQQLRITRLDELGCAGDAFNKLVIRLRENLCTLAARADTVKSSASEMATASQQVAAAADQQSDAASNMAATLEQVSVSINHVADKAGETDAVVRDVSRISASGEKAIKAVMQDIQGIAETVSGASDQIEGVDRHSAEIASVVQVIKEVADQTNLLALNAAIEAARAGESGRGFAVVADEVRKLAERTAHSTAEIDKTVTTMRESAHTAVENMQAVSSLVGAGVERASQTNAEIARISLSCQAAAAMVTDIAQSIREQGAAANSIAAQVERIAQMSDESSAAAHTNAETAGKLDHVAADMRQIIGAYRLDAKHLA